MSAQPRRRKTLDEMHDDTPSSLLASLITENMPRGTFFPFEASDDYTQQLDSLQEQYMAMSLHQGISDIDPIAVDVRGQLDVEYGNPGPEIHVTQQMTSSGLLSVANEEEILAAAKQERYRGLSLFPKKALAGGPLREEIEALEEDDDVHSVSVISLNQREVEEWPPCPPDCWARDARAVPETPVLRSLAPASDAQIVASIKGKSSVYVPIGRRQARLLHVQPGLYGEPIVCSLSVMNVAQRDAAFTTVPTYEALSYTWGDGSPKFIVQCNGHSLPVAHNLFFALQHLRLQTVTRHMWIDALCINQQDPQERSEQVQHMLQIYQNASHVIVWLGEEEGNSHLALESMKYLDECEQREAITLRRHESECYNRLSQIYNAQWRIFQRPWFRRSWIRQEISAAKDVTVVCGRNTIGWYAMKRSAARLSRLYEKLQTEGVEGLSEFTDDQAAAVACLTRGWIFGQSVIKLIGCIGSVWYHHTGGFLDLLMAGREFDATDARDKVYSVVGLGRVPTATLGDDQPASTSLPIDYSKSVSEVYQDVVKYFVNKDGNLDILSILLTHRNDASDAELPSWVPDWRVPASEVAITAHWDFISMKLAAGGFRTNTVPQSFFEVGILRVEGWVVDSIESLDDHCARVTSMLDTLPEFNEVADAEEEDACDDDDETGKDPVRQARLRGERALYAEPFDPEHHKARCCITASGRLCLAPAGAAPGDDIALVLGSKLAFVLRQDTSEAMAALYPDIPSSARFRLVGPCVVPDIMFGRLVREFHEAGLRPAQFVLV
ncbi:HET-domain-containing protein [Thozetella sp. PMI_491]|nr:HET-domain-containing protein [Thozetella sp. PMI_491]